MATELKDWVLEQGEKCEANDNMEYADRFLEIIEVIEENENLLERVKDMQDYCEANNVMYLTKR